MSQEAPSQSTPSLFPHHNPSPELNTTIINKNPFNEYSDQRHTSHDTVILLAPIFPSTCHLFPPPFVETIQSKLQQRQLPEPDQNNAHDAIFSYFVTLIIDQAHNQESSFKPIVPDNN